MGVKLSQFEGGWHGGRPQNQLIFSQRGEEAVIFAMLESGQSVPAIAKVTKLHRATLYRMKQCGMNGRTKIEPVRKDEAA